MATRAGTEAVELVLGSGSMRPVQLADAIDEIYWRMFARYQQITVCMTCGALIAVRLDPEDDKGVSHGQCTACFRQEHPEETSS